MAAPKYLSGTQTIKDIRDRMNVLEKYGIYTSLADLRNAAAGDFPYTLITNTGKLEYTYTEGNFSTKEDNHNIIKLNSKDLSQGALVLQTVGNFGVQSTPGGPIIRTDDSYCHTTRLSKYTRSGSLNDYTSAFQDAIQDAVDRKLARIIIPSGTYPVGQIVNGSLPYGLMFEAEGACSLNPNESSVELRCGNSGATWNIRYPDGNDGQTGGWTWRGLRFISMVADNTIFDLNDTTTHSPVEPGGYSKIIHPSWESCYFDLASGVTGTRTGDGVRMAKVFAPHFDARCQFGNFRRSIWGRGSDDARISARMAGQRGIMLEGVNSFGSNALIDSRFISSPVDGPEDGYHVHDTAKGTTILATSFEGQGREKALMFLGGQGTKVIGPRLAGGRLFELGRYGRDIKIINPEVSGYDANWAPIINAPDESDFGIADYRVEVIGATRNFKRMVGDNPRVVYTGGTPVEGVGAPIDQRRAMVTAINGLRPAKLLLSTNHNGSFSAGTDAASGPSATVQDPLARTPNNWVFEFDHAKPNAGINWSLIVGNDVQKSDKLRLRWRYISGDSANGWLLRVFRNSAPDPVNGFQFLTGTSGSYVNMDRIIDLASYENGDNLRFMIYQFAPANAKVRLAYMSLAQVSDGIALPSGGSVIDAESRAAIASIMSILKERDMTT